MLKIDGYWYDGINSRQQEAVMQIDGEGDVSVLVANSAAEPLFAGEFSQLRVSGRLGNSVRYLYFTDNQKFETRDNDQVDHAVNQFHKQHFNSWIYKLENRWRYVALATVLMVLVVAWTAIYGVPMAAKLIAQVMPQALVDKAGEQTLAFLDKDMMQPSELEEDVQQRVRDHFSGIMADHPDLNIKLHFRDSIVGPNAFALPDGSIVFTDEMIELAENDDELLSVMAHEIGHVVHQHGMRSVIQGSMISFALMLMSGDASVATELFLGIPVILTQLGYSRNFEREADDYALAYMRENGIETAHFARLMGRLQASMCPVKPVADGESTAEPTTVPDDLCEEQDWQRYLSTHPGMAERIEKFAPTTDAEK